MVRSSVATKFSLPMLLAIVVLLGGFAAIAVTVQWATAGSSERIGQATTAGAAAVSVPASNNVANSLPAFSLDVSALTTYAPQPSEVPFVSDPPVRFMSAEEEAAFQNHTWLAVAHDRGIKNVWGGAWFPCRHIDAGTLTYNTIRTDPALAVWAKLAPSDQNDIAKECKKP